MNAFRPETACEIAVLGLAVLLMAGCTSTFSGGGYPLKLTQMNVDWKMTAYREAVAAGNLTAGQQQAVTSAYQAYQTAFQQALAAARATWNRPPPITFGSSRQNSSD